MIVCPVPKDSCIGVSTLVGTTLQKAHRTINDVHKCIAKHLAKQGYTQNPDNRREYFKEGSPVLMVSKKPGTYVYYTKVKTRHE